jgi:hypothetical protein
MKALILVLLFPFLSSAGELTVSWSTEFTGSFDGKKNVRLLLYRNKDNSLIGSYYNTKELIRYEIKGKASGDHLEFTAEKANFTFKGNLSDGKKPILTGTSTQNEKSTPSTFTYHIHFPSRPGGNLYAPICADSTQEVEDFAKKIKVAILAKDKDTLAKNVHYPVDISLAGKFFTIKTKEDFLVQYDNIFTPNFVKSIKENCIPMNMCNSYKGVWFGFKRELIIQMMRKGDGPFQLRVAAINNKLNDKE